MAEHVAGEPEPASAGSRETFTVTAVKPSRRLGLEDMPLRDLPPGDYYLALCSWDDDRNLSAVSNVIRITLK
jgi:hypothetical protein